MPERALRTFSWASPKRPHHWQTAWPCESLFPKPGNTAHVMCERAGQS
nr:putative integron gene cassette protein [uncultured bacterium]